ncbi:MAG: hypothetical protein AAFY11_15970 [Cyanobacteria bacterium J06641_5]
MQEVNVEGAIGNCHLIADDSADAMVKLGGKVDIIQTAWDNSLHWVLDVTFKEDRSRIRMGHGPENMAMLRRLCVNLIKRHPSKDSIKTKRFRAALSHNFLMDLLAISGE